MPSGFSADGNDGLGLGSHITGGLSSLSTSDATPSAVLAWALIIGAVLLLLLMGMGLGKVRI